MRLFDGQAVHFDLAHQANGATLGHAQAAEVLTAEQQAAVIDFELSVFAAQIHDIQAGPLLAARADGGPRALADQSLSSNSGLGAATVVLTLFNARASPATPADAFSEARQAIAIDQDIFKMGLRAAQKDALVAFLRALQAATTLVASR